jgi:hypothetical protein
MPSAGVRSHALATGGFGPALLPRNAPPADRPAVRTLTPRPLIQVAVGVQLGQGQSRFVYRPTSWPPQDVVQDKISPEMSGMKGESR